MKQVAKTQQVVDRLRAAFGPDVDVSKLPVYEAVALNTMPLRKSGGLFKGAVPTQRTLTDMASSINAESAPIQVMHDTDTTPFGRAFYCEVIGDEARTLFTVTDPVKATSIDNGTIDQVSVGFMPASITCSACGWDYLGADATMDNLWGLVCANDHTLGDNGVHGVLDGVASFYELSLVGKGAAQGARIVGPSESRLQGLPQYRLAASAGIGGVHLTATPKDNSSVDLTALTASLTAATTEAATTKVHLTAAECARDQALTQLATANAKIVELEAGPKQADLEAANASVAAATAALKTEATTILTACGKQMDLEGKDASALLAIIGEHRAQFAAAIPVDGMAAPSHSAPKEPATRPSAAAFSTRR